VLLSVEEREVLNRLAVFPGGFSLNAAEQVCGDRALPGERIWDLLTRLVEKSMVQREEGVDGSVAVARREARMYLRKAGQFLEEAHEAVAAERHDASLLNAIHVAISAADAVTVVLAGRRSADPDHQRAADLLEEMATTGRQYLAVYLRARACPARVPPPYRGDRHLHGFGGSLRCRGGRSPQRAGPK
jgi:predicted ATPase